MVSRVRVSGARVRVRVIIRMSPRRLTTSSAVIIWNRFVSLTHTDTHTHIQTRSGVGVA